MELKQLPPEIYAYCIESIFPPKKEWQIDHFEVIERPGMYGQNNGVIAFIDETGTRFETPFVSRIVEVLKEAGYEPSGLVGVPLSNDATQAYPSPTYGDKWDKLCAVAMAEEKQAELAKEQMYIESICKTKNISALPAEVAETTVALPREGLAVRQLGVAEIEVNKPVGLGDMQKLMGTYSTNNGHIVFVDHNGQTRSSETTDELIQALNQAGYEPSSMGVPVDDFLEFVTEPTEGQYVDPETLNATREFSEQWQVAKNIIREREELKQNVGYTR